MAPVMPSQVELDRRKIVGVKAETVTNISSTDYPGHFPGEDHAWDLTEFKEAFHVSFHQNEPYDASFSLIGIDASVANAFRRILLDSIPTLAVESVFMYNNTSIVQDEVLAHRLGLIPLTGSAEGLAWLQYIPRVEGEPPASSTDSNTIVMKLQVECTWKDGAKPNEEDPLKLYNHAHVYAKDLQWMPAGRQPSMFPSPDGFVRPVNPDILIAKMRPGQAIDLEVHCVKGVGSDHAKFSPVATASYRLMPTITLLRPIIGEDAKKFARCFPKGVVEKELVTEEEASRKGSGYEGHAGELKAVVKNPFIDTVSRECLRHDEFKGKVKLGRVRDHFIFGVESTGQYESDFLFLDSVKLLKLKCTSLKRELGNIMR